MKIIAVNRSSDTVPYLICICRDFSLNEEDVLEIILANEPYRTDFPAKPDKIIIHPDDMSSVIIDSFWSKLNSQKFDIKAESAKYAEFWENSKNNNLTMELKDGKIVFSPKVN